MQIFCVDISSDCAILFKVFEKLNDLAMFSHSDITEFRLIGFICLNAAQLCFSSSQD